MPSISLLSLVGLLGHAVAFQPLAWRHRAPRTSLASSSYLDSIGAGQATKPSPAAPPKTSHGFQSVEPAAASGSSYLDSIGAGQATRPSPAAPPKSSRGVQSVEPTAVASGSYLDSIGASHQATKPSPAAPPETLSPGLRSCEFAASSSSYLDTLSGGEIRLTGSATSDSKSYLKPDSGSKGAAGAVSVQQASSLGSYLDSLLATAGVPSATGKPATPAPPPPQYIQSAEKDMAAPSLMKHAPLSYFHPDKLTPKDPRTTADVGQPQEATRSLEVPGGGPLRAGSWWCSEGGWPSPNPKKHTEIFYMITGHGCLTDADGMRHYFGPGDTVIIPKGHTGRWDVFSPIHKVWAVNEHPYIADNSKPIRVVVEHYNRYFDESLFDFEQVGSAMSRPIYDVGPTQVGVCVCFPGTWSETKPKRSFFHMLEGTMFLTDEDGSTAKRCVPGDTVIVPEWWSGHMEVIDTAKMLWVEVESGV